MEKRKTQRFKLQLPLALTRSGAGRVAFTGYTHNISSGGVLFTTGAEPDLGGAIEYVITLSHDGPQAVNLRCMGKVVRTERLGAANEHDLPAYQVAATLERYEFFRDR